MIWLLKIYYLCIKLFSCKMSIKGLSSTQYFTFVYRHNEPIARTGLWNTLRDCATSTVNHQAWMIMRDYNIVRS